MQHPQRGRDAREDERCGVHSTDDLHRDGEQRRIPPASVAQRTDREPEQPAERGPGQEDHRDSGCVVKRVRAERVRERGDRDSGSPATERAAQVEHPGCCGEDERAKPQALRRPVGQPDPVERPVERAHREQVPDVLVGDRSHPDVRVPHRRRTLQEAPGVEVEVLLRVGGYPAPVGQQRREVRERREKRVAERRRSPPGVPARHAALCRLPGGARGVDRHVRDRRRRTSAASTSSVPRAVAPHVNLAA